MTSAKQKKYWAEVTADMISDEENVGDKYILYPPSYRSERLTRFIHKLDSRLEITPSRHARYSRVLGSPVHKNIPSKAKKWMMKSSEESPPCTGEENPEPTASDVVASDVESFELSEDETQPE